MENRQNQCGEMGKLAKIAEKIAMIQETLTPKLHDPVMVVFAGDHGIARSGVSPFPQEVTFQMVLNFLNQGAAINVFCRQNSIEMKVVDAGVNGDFDPHPDLIICKMGYGTKNILEEPAMTKEVCEKTIENGAKIILEHVVPHSNVVGFGEMGIGNTSSAALLMHGFLGIPIEDCVGRGTGLDDSGLARKKEILSRAVSKHQVDDDPISVLSTFGGFEITMMCGAMLCAAQEKITILVDGFIATSAFLAARAIAPEVMDYAIFCHASDEAGHARMLSALGADPLLDLSMRLGEGTGAALAYPLIASVVEFLTA